MTTEKAQRQLAVFRDQLSMAGVTAPWAEDREEGTLWVRLAVDGDGLCLETSVDKEEWEVYDFDDSLSLGDSFLGWIQQLLLRGES